MDKRKTALRRSLFGAVHLAFFSSAIMRSMVFSFTLNISQSALRSVVPLSISAIILDCFSLLAVARKSSLICVMCSGSGVFVPCGSDSRKTPFSACVPPQIKHK